MGFQYTAAQGQVLHRFGAELSFATNSGAENPGERVTCHIRDLATGELYEAKAKGPSEQIAADRAIALIPTAVKPMTAAQRATSQDAGNIIAEKDAEIARLKALLEKAQTTTQQIDANTQQANGGGDGGNAGGDGDKKGPPALDGLNVAQLRSIAVEEKVEGDIATMKKAELIEAINKVRTAKAAETQ